jgi:glycerate kinase
MVMQMKILIAPDSYKGSLTALEVGEAMKQGLAGRWPDAEIFLVPMADGGEGTTLALAQATRGSLVYRWVTDPLGQPVEAYFGVLGSSKTAVVEVAQASGLPLVPEDKRNPLVTTSFGTGELVKEALDYGCDSLIMGIGGSATNDGGMGLLSALGVKFLDQEGRPLTGWGTNLDKIHIIDTAGLDRRLAGMTVKVACDVTNPLCGPKGASAVYGPQKGATPAMVEELDRGLAHFALKIKEFLGVDVGSLPGSGAAGGIGAGLVAFLKAQLVPGVELIIEATGMEELAAQAELVLTGEGRTDGQTIFGKAPAGVAQLAKRHGKPVICISGSLGEGWEQVHEVGIDAVFSICSGPLTLAEAMNDAAKLIRESALQVARLWQASSGQRSKR